MPPGFGTNPDHLFPLYIVSELPQGVAGFVMAGLFAATVSSFASVLNALASTTVADFLLPLSKRLRSSGRPVSGDASAAEADPSERRVFFFSRASTLVWGAMLMVLALAFRGSRQNVVDLALSALTYFYGALLGAFLLGVFTRRGTARSIVLGMTASVPVVLLLQLRRFLDAPSIAPDLVRTWLEAIPPSVSAAVLEWVPALDWKYWIIVGTAVSFGIGALVQGKAGEQA
jgi:Na+/proline symporter